MLFSWACDTAPTDLSQTNVESFVHCVKNHIEKNADVIVINCNDISSYNDHCVDPIVDFISNTKVSLIFFSNDNKAKLTNHLVEFFNKAGLNNSKSFSEGKVKTFCIDNQGFDSTKVMKFIEDSLALEHEWLSKQITKTYQKYDSKHRLSSTPLQASGEFNATRILSDPIKYRWVVVVLAEMVNRIIQEERPKTYTVITASLRGAVIAEAVWELLYFVSRPTLHIVDHMGPKHDLLEIPKEDNIAHNDYFIYVGDFAIGGTEIKIANSYCNFFRRNIRHAFVIGKYIKEEYLGQNIRLHSLVELRDCVKELEYSLG